MITKILPMTEDQAEARIARMQDIRTRLIERYRRKVRAFYESVWVEFEQRYKQKHKTKKFVRPETQAGFRNLDPEIWADIYAEYNPKLKAMVSHYDIESSLWYKIYYLRQEYRIPDPEIRIEYIKARDGELAEYNDEIYTDGWYVLNAKCGGIVQHIDPCGPFETQEHAKEFARFATWGNEDESL